MNLFIFHPHSSKAHRNAAYFFIAIRKQTGRLNSDFVEPVENTSHRMDGLFDVVGQSVVSADFGVENIKQIPVARYMDKTSTRIIPTVHKPTAY